MKSRSESESAPSRIRRTVRVATCAAALMAGTGCGPKVGALIWAFGNPTLDVEAEHTLGRGPLLILVDTIGPAADRVPPNAKDMLADALARHFRENKVNEQIIPTRRLVELRRVEPDYESLAADRVGKRVGAEQVLFIQVDFKPAQTAGDGETELITGASCTADVRLLYAKAEAKKDVRLWPNGRPGSPGKMVDARLTVHEARALSTAEDRARKLTETLADQIAKLFYFHQIKTHDE